MACCDARCDSLPTCSPCLYQHAWCMCVLVQTTMHHDVATLPTHKVTLDITDGSCHKMTCAAGCVVSSILIHLVSYVLPCIGSGQPTMSTSTSSVSICMGALGMASSAAGKVLSAAAGCAAAAPAFCSMAALQGCICSIAS